MNDARPHSWPLAAIATLGAIIPLVLLWWVVWRQPTIAPAEAQRQIDAGAAVLVDVRDDGEYRRQHITGALRPGQVPVDRLNILVCDDGLRSARSAATMPGRDVAVLKEGIAGWIAAARKPDTIRTGLTRDGVDGPLPMRSEPAAIQWLTVLTGFLVKPGYMLLALVAAILLRRARTPGTVALRRSLWCFFLGEAFCALNYLAFDEENLIADHLHSVGMLLAMAFGAWAAWNGLHRHAIGSDGSRCALGGVCRPCTRDRICRADQALPLIAGGLMLAACVPLTTDPIPAWVSLTTVLGTPYAYRHDMAQQLIEVRWYPLCGLALALWSLVPWWRGQPAVATAWLCAAAGAIGFALFRVLLVQVWRDDPAWFLAWEELSEFASLIAVWWWMPVLRRHAEVAP
jgi:rhodanese-related sulfurtransferase